MFPKLIEFGTYDLPLVGETDLFLPTYGVLFAIGVVAAWLWFMRRARRLDLPDDQLFNLSFYSLLAGILGAKLLLVMVDWRNYLASPLAILGTLRAAGVLVGGVAAGALTFAWYCKRHALPLWSLADAVAAPLVLAQAAGRLGCFSAGCCWGVQVDPDHPLAVVFTNPAAREQTGVSLDVPLVATQLVEFSFDMLLVMLLSVLWHRRLRPPGTVFWIYVLLYSVGRGIIEFWRGDTQRGLYFNDQVSTSQLVAIGGLVLALIMLGRGLQVRRQQRQARASST